METETPVSASRDQWVVIDSTSDDCDDDDDNDDVTEREGSEGERAIGGGMGNKKGRNSEKRSRSFAACVSSLPLSVT